MGPESFLQVNHQPVVELVPKVPTHGIVMVQMPVYIDVYTGRSIQDAQLTLLIDTKVKCQLCKMCR